MATSISRIQRFKSPARVAIGVSWDEIEKHKEIIHAINEPINLQLCQNIEEAMRDTCNNPAKRYMALVDIAKYLKRDRSTIMRVAKRWGFNIEKIRSPRHQHQLISVIAVSDLRKFLNALEGTGQIYQPDEVASLIDNVRQKER